ncbi:hypothetical protein AKH21_02785 [Pelagibacteraceae bacterium GOM-A5]|nr:hypothetical protein AKH21_02785 [Pelagibacteraceae bacterium GOM-A5]
MNYLETLNFGSNKLKLKNIRSHILDSELLLSFTLNLSREKILINLNEKIKKQKFNIYKRLLSRREKNEPIAYIIKKKEFWRNIFYVNKNVLIPRPETELIVEEVLKVLKIGSSKRLLEIGTGSGCIILSILQERLNCCATAIDISKKALNIAKFNAKMHHLTDKIKFINNDIDKFNDNEFNFVISNPPYINKFNISRLDKDVKLFEPNQALEAGVDGLREIKKLIKKSKKLLKINGKLIFEIGESQQINAKKMLIDNGYYINKVIKDLSSIPRVIVSTNIM